MLWLGVTPGFKTRPIRKHSRASRSCFMKIHEYPCLPVSNALHALRISFSVLTARAPKVRAGESETSQALTVAKSKCGGSKSPAMPKWGKLRRSHQLSIAKDKVQSRSMLAASEALHLWLKCNACTLLHCPLCTAQCAAQNFRGFQVIDIVLVLLVALTSALATTKHHQLKPNFV